MTTAYATDGSIVNFNQVDTLIQFELGTVIQGSDGRTYRYCQASEALTAASTTLKVTSAFAVSEGAGDAVGPSFAVASGQFCWVGDKTFEVLDRPIVYRGNGPVIYGDDAGETTTTDVNIVTQAIPAGVMSIGSVIEVGGLLDNNSVTPGGSNLTKVLLDGNEVLNRDLQNAAALQHTGFTWRGFAISANQIASIRTSDSFSPEEIRQSGDANIETVDMANGFDVNITINMNASTDEIRLLGWFIRIDP